MPGSRKSKKKRGRKAAPPVLVARVNEQVALEVYANGKVGTYVDGYAFEIGMISPGSVKRAQGLSEGVPVGSFSPARKPVDREIEALARHLARRGLLEYGLAPPGGEDRGGDRTTDSRLLAADCKARQCRHHRALAFRLSSTARQRPRAGIAAVARTVPHRRSQDRRGACRTYGAAKGQQASPRKGFRWARAAWLARRLRNPVQGRTEKRRPAAGRGRRKSRGLGLSRFPVPHPLDRGPSGQSAGRALSLCRQDRPAAGGARAMGRQRDRPGGICGRARLAARRAAALAALGPRFRRGETDHACRARAISRRRRARAVEMDQPVRFRRRYRRSRSSLYVAPLPLRRERLRARALFVGERLRGACARPLSLRRRPPCAGADRGPRARARSAACGREFRHGYAWPAADPRHHRRALQPHRLEVQRYRLFAGSQRCRRTPADVLSHG